MKKIFLLLLTFLTALFVSCQKMPEASHTDSVVIFSQIPQLPSGEGSLKVTVYATTDWSIEGEGWLSVAPGTGTTGISETVLVFAENQTGEDRTATLRLRAGSYTHTQSVTQSK